MTPEPAPYGADEAQDHGRVESLEEIHKRRSIPAGDSEIAEILWKLASPGAAPLDVEEAWRVLSRLGACEAERDALREVVERARSMCAIVEPPLAGILMPAARRRDLMIGYRLAMKLVTALLPAPTEEAAGGSGANTGEAGRG